MTDKEVRDWLNCIDEVVGLINRRIPKIKEWLLIEELPDGSYVCRNPKEDLISDFFLN